MADDDERIRRKAYELWLADGCPEGRHEAHWEQAREIIALEDVGGPPTIPVEKTLEDPVEPAIAFENQGEFPGLTDQGRAPPVPRPTSAPRAPTNGRCRARDHRPQTPGQEDGARRVCEGGSGEGRFLQTPGRGVEGCAPGRAAGAPATRRRKPRANGAGVDAG